ncbi:MAG: helix-turn-helix transcriptional regulator [Bacilli bacterium]|jgi:transcriptional regulator with XRE-family HTH domain|nr:helix-turn-helix transcriptional regulator [Bacilli bacterium]
MSIGEKIYDLRKKKNMSQEDLASVLNVSRQTISKWETGESNPDFDKIVPLCNFFEISTDEFLKGSNPILEEKIERVNNKNKALTFSMCIVIFIVMCILIEVFESIEVDESITTIISIACIGAISIILIYYFLSKPFEQISIKKKESIQRRNLISSIINLTILIVYLINSFIWGWEYTWIILIVGLLIKKIVFLSLLLKEDKKENKNEK